MILGLIPYRALYILGFCGFFFCLSTSEYVLSMSQFLLVFAALIERDFKTKWKSIKSSNLVKVTYMLLAVSLVALSYTQNWDEALNDLRIKIPLFLLPLVLAFIEPFSKKELQLIIAAFVLGCLFSVTFSWIHFESLPNNSFIEQRSGSFFISHIRLSLMLVISSIILFKTAVSKGVGVILRLVCSAIIIYMVSYMVYFQFITGLVVLFPTILVIALWMALKSNRNALKYGVLITSVVLITGAIYFTYNVVQSFFEPKEYTTIQNVKYTPENNVYKYWENDFQLENGYRVWYAVCEYELELAWKNKSEISYLDKGNTGEPIRNCLIRFMSSKGWPKDGDKVMKLSDEEVKAIENGETNVLYMNKKSLSRRVYQTAWELHNYWINGDNPSGNSFAMRLEYWKVALKTFLREPILGIGRGDMVDEMNAMYKSSGSKLSPEYYQKPHNQYLTQLVSYGVIGLFVFLIVLFYPTHSFGKHWVLLSIWFVLVLSMFTEDTLEAQIGVSMFSGFFFVMWRNAKENGLQKLLG